MKYKLYLVCLIYNLQPTILDTLLVFIRHRLQSFLYAFKGLALFFNSQLHAKIHSLAAAFVILLGWLFQLFWYEWALLVVAIGLVFLAETFNTAIEFLVNFVSPDDNEQAGKVKDLAAGAVLLAALTAFIIGLLIFVPKFMRII